MGSKNQRIYTLVFVKRDNEILLGFKKRGLYEGKWNGFGGKVENETIEQGALRELEEESGLICTAENLRKIGILEFDGREKDTLLIVHVYDTYTYSGDLTESPEMLPMWFKRDDIPYNMMNADVTDWFQLMLEGIFFKGYFLYQGEDNIIDKNIEILSELI